MEEKNYLVPDKPTREFCLQCLEDENLSVRQDCIKFLVAELFKDNPLFPVLYAKHQGWYFGTLFASENILEVHTALFQFIDKHDNVKNIQRFINILDIFYQHNSNIPQKDQLLLNFLFKMSAINPQRQKLAKLILLHYDCNSGKEEEMIKKSQDFPELIPVILRQFHFNAKHLWDTGLSCNYSGCLSKLNTGVEEAAEALELLIPYADFETLACIARLSNQLKPEQQEAIQDKIVVQLKKLRSTVTIRVGSFLQVAYFLPWEKGKSFYEYWMTPETAKSFASLKEVTVCYARFIGKNSDKGYWTALKKLDDFFELLENRSYIGDTIEVFFKQIICAQDYPAAYRIYLLKWLQRYSADFNDYGHVLALFQGKIRILYGSKPEFSTAIQKLYQLVLRDCPPNDLIRYWIPEHGGADSPIHIRDTILNLNIPALPDKGEGIYQALMAVCDSAVGRHTVTHIINFINQEYNLNWNAPADIPAKHSQKNEYIQKVKALFAVP